MNNTKYHTENFQKIHYYLDVNNSNFNNFGLNVLYLNAVSIRNKLDNITLFIKSFNFKIHIIVICETRLKQNETKIFNIEGYTAHHSTREGKYRGGGCSIYIDSLIPSSKIYEQCLDNQNILIVKLNKNKLNIVAIYRPPGSDLNQFMKKLKNIISNYSNSLIVGDFNINILNNNNSLVDEYLNSLSMYGFQVLNKVHPKFSTRSTDTTSTILDHLITDNNIYKYKFAISDVSFSDHKFILLNINTNNKKREEKINSYTKHVLDYESINTPSLENNLSKITTFNELINFLKSIITKHTKQINVKFNKNRKRWTTPELLHLIRERERLYKYIKKYPNDIYIQENYSQIKNDIKYLRKISKKITIQINYKTR